MTPPTAPKALITGITGQDGSYLAELLMIRGYEVWGLVRRSSRTVMLNLDRAASSLLSRALHLVEGDLTDTRRVEAIVRNVKPDYIFNLAAQSYVASSWGMLSETWAVNATAAILLMDIASRIVPNCRFYQASTSELFGREPAPQNEQTAIRPVSPYGVSKAAAHLFAGSLRAKGFFIVCGILFNHESPRRGRDFVSRKIARQVAEIVVGKRKEMVLGDLTPRRDWGWAPDYVLAMADMLRPRVVDPLREPEPKDYVIATGEARTVGEFVRTACEIAGVMDCHILTDRKLLRPTEVYDLRGDASLAREELGWSPTCDFKCIVRRMVDAELKALGHRGMTDG